MSDAQKHALLEGKQKAKEAREANPEQAYATVVTFKPVKTKVVAAKMFIPRGTPIAGIQTVVDGIVEQMRTRGITATTVTGKLRVM